MKPIGKYISTEIETPLSNILNDIYFIPDVFNIDNGILRNADNVNMYSIFGLITEELNELFN